MSFTRIYRLDQYSIPDLLELLRTERGERIRLETGSQSSLTVKGKEYEIDGPPLDGDTAEQLLRPVANTRQMRAFRKFSTVDIIYRFEGMRFLIRVVRAFGISNVEVHAIKL